MYLLIYYSYDNGEDVTDFIAASNNKAELEDIITVAKECSDRYDEQQRKITEDFFNTAKIVNYYDRFHKAELEIYEAIYNKYAKDNLEVTLDNIKDYGIHSLMKKLNIIHKDYFMKDLYEVIIAISNKYSIKYEGKSNFTLFTKRNLTLECLV
jgi:hypothetical protein